MLSSSANSWQCAWDRSDRVSSAAKILQYAIIAVVLTGVYFLLGYSGLYLKFHYDGLSPIWPAAGLGVALLWLFDVRWWPVIVVGEYFSAVVAGRSPLIGGADGVVQLVEALLAAGLLNGFGVQAEFKRSRDVLGLAFFGCLVPAVVGGGLGIVGLYVDGLVKQPDLLRAWGNWSLGDAMGILIITPLIAEWRRWPFADNKALGSWLLSMLILIGGILAIMRWSGDSESNLYFLLLPLVVLIAARNGTWGASSAAIVLAAFVLLSNLGSVHDLLTLSMRIAFIGATAFTGYLVAAALAARSAADAAREAEQDRALVTLQALGEGVISTHGDGKVYFINAIAERLTGWRGQDAVGRNIEDVFPLSLASGETDQEHTVRHCLMHGASSEILTRRMLRDRAGTLRPVEGTITTVRARDGRIIGGVVVFRDVSESEQLRERLTHEATHDSLTGLRNRAAFDRHLRELSNGEDRKARHAMLYLDLDQFKVINDTRGHEIGDRLLIELTKRLRALVHKPDIIARLGGDEFGVLVMDANERMVLLQAEELRRAVLDYRFKEHELTFTVGVSVGVTFFSPGERSQDVLARADMACYIAKEAGRNGIHVYRTDDASMMRRHSEMTRVSQLQTAMQENRFKLYGQRIVPLQNGKNGNAANGHFYEVLLRLMENGQVVPPAAFLPAAGRFGLAANIDRWVLDQSFKFLADKASYGIRLSVNLDARTLDSPDFQRHVQEFQARYQVKPQSVCFEVTENVALEHLNRAVDTMHRLSEAGYQFSLDDFGSGVASFGYLQQLPVHYVKIDGRFVQNFSDDAANPLIIRTLVELARLRGIECIAECVENEATKVELTKLGVDFGQGFFLHRPEPLPA